MDTKQVLLDFCAQTGVAGRESQAAAYAKTLLEPFGKVSVSPLGSVICTVKEPAANGVHILLDAHIDEIGMVVTYIDEQGFLKVSACGGIDKRLLSAAPVWVHAKGGDLKGVVCSVPPHLAGKEAPRNLDVDEIFIDIGAKTKEESAALVKLGDLITVVSTPRELLNGLVSTKATDDRAGCVSLLKALEYLQGFELTAGLTVQFSTMEEVGGHGAETAAYLLNPTHAVAVDVSYAVTPDAQPEKCGELCKGPMIGIAPILSREVTLELITLAEQNNIPYQREVMGGQTGTNADHIAAVRAGIRTGLLSVPQKYMHTPIETVCIEDIENTGRLLAEFVKSTMRKAGV